MYLEAGNESGNVAKEGLGVSCGGFAVELQTVLERRVDVRGRLLQVLNDLADLGDKSFHCAFKLGIYIRRLQLAIELFIACFQLGDAASRFLNVHYARISLPLDKDDASNVPLAAL